MIIKIFLSFFLIQIISIQILYFKFMPENVRLPVMIAVMVLFTVGICQRFFKKTGLTWNETIGYANFKNYVFKSVVFGICGAILALISVKFTMSLIPNEWALKIMDELLKPNSSKFLIIFANIRNDYVLGDFFVFILMGGFVFTEEVIFRGLMFRYIEKRKNFIVAILVTSLIFSLAHIAPYKVLFTFSYSVIWGLSLVAAKNLISPILAHCLFNVSLFYFGDHLGKWLLKGL
ncbi:MAG: CPBP family intramembrane metalloprotease [Elusimicrobia bacterium]|nr:CPBP family intramembrane metalloprotease [Elusimicrobiota bacterium]